MQMDTDAMLQAYGMSSEFPEKWQNSGFSTALATLGSASGEADDNEDGAVVDDLLESLTASTSVAADEPDPLGTGLTILQLLEQQSHIVPKSAAERAVYMPSSTSFDPRKFLRDCHSASSLGDLERGLTYLKQRMMQKEQGGRKETVDHEYDSYVSTKRRLDDVMMQLDQTGIRPDTKFAMKDLEHQLTEARNQLAIRARPIDNINVEKQRLENALSALEKHRKKLEVPQVLAKLAESGEHDQFVREYKKGIRLLTTSWVESKDSSAQQLGAFMIEEAHKVRHNYLHNLHSELMKTPADGAYAPLISKLMDLGVSGNPAVEWLEHNIKHFADEIDVVFNSLITTATRNLAEAVDSGRQLDLATYLRHLVANNAVHAPTQRHNSKGTINTSKSGSSSDLSVETVYPNVGDLCDELDAETWIDFEGSVAQWIQISEFFERLRLILNRCAVFFREFLSLSQNSAASSGSWQLSQVEITRVLRQCQDLVKLSSRRLVESLSAPVVKSLALPIATAHSRDDKTQQGLLASEKLSFLPYNSNSLAAAKYLGKILETLTVMMAQITELSFPDSDSPQILSDAVGQVKTQFVKTLCACWTRDSQQLGQIQDWSRWDLKATNQPKLPQFFAAYHGIILEYLRFMLDPSRGGGPVPDTLLSHVVQSFPVALSLSIRSIESALIDSTKASTLADSHLAEIRAQLLPASLGQDAKLLVTLSYLETLRYTGLERVYEQFESIFKNYRVPIKTIKDEITPEVDKISGQLFDIYIRKKRSKLSQIINQEFQRLVPIWRDETREVRRVSNYIYECLMVLVETHALFMESCPQMTRRAVLELFKQVLSVMLSQLRALDQLNRYGTLQNIADLEFMRWALSQLPEATELQQRIFAAIRHISTDEEAWTLADGPRGAVKGPLTDAVRQSHFAFLSFKSFERTK